MKTSPSARHLVRMRRIMLGAALAAVLGLEVYAGEVVAARIGHTTTAQTDGPAIADIGWPTGIGQ